MKALVDYNVPAALSVTEQFFRSQRAIEAATCWTSGQFTGRIGHFEKRPGSLTRDDLQTVARAFSPTGDARAIEGLVEYANRSKQYLAGIEHVAARARFLASREELENVTCADIRCAVKESVIPSDAAISAAKQATQTPRSAICDRRPSPAES